MDLNQVFNQLDDMMRRADIDNVIPYLEGQCKQAEAEGDGGSLLSILNELVGFCRETCQYEKAMEYAAAALQVIEQIGIKDTVHHATTLLNIANCLRAAGKLTDSLNTYHQVEAMYHRMLPEKDFGFASLYNNESLLYQELKDFDNAYESLKKALAIVLEYPDKEWELAVTYANLANTCLQVDLTDKADDSLTESAIEEYADKSIELFHKLGETDTHIAAALTAKGQILERKGQYVEAISCYEEALKAIKTTLGETDFFRRVAEYLKAAVRRSGEAYSGEFEYLISGSGLSFIKGLELDREFYEAVGKPMLLEKYAEYFPYMTIGMVGEGSDCFGFDDEASMDHDWGPGFYIWLDQDLYEKIGESLQADYDALPKEFKGFRRMNTEHGEKRVGVRTTSEFCSYYVGTINYRQWQQEGHISSNDMLGIPMYKLAAFVNGEIFHEAEDDYSGSSDVDSSYTGDVRNASGTGHGDICRLREYLKGYYDKVTTLKLLCQNLAEFGQNAQYNYPRMMKRGDYAVAMQLLHTGLSKAVVASYILNKQYAPHDKWLMRGTRSFKLLTEVPKLVERITIEAARTLSDGVDASDDSSLNKVLDMIEELANMLLNESIRQEYIGDTRLITVPGRDGWFVDTYLEHYTSDMVYRASFITMRHDVIVETIARMEFEAFDKVKNEGGRAECQDDWDTFRIMRVSQYTTWTDEMLVQYAVDFSLAKDRGWNPIMEKYGRMEESTSPEEWDKIKDRFPVIPPEKKQIMEEIIKIQVAWMEAFAKEYPGLASHARRIHTSEDMPWDTSYETYLRGEIGTYSDKMLKLYGQFIVGMVKSGDNLAYRIMNETIHMYGYSSFEEAMKNQQ